MRTFLDFEKPVADVFGKIEELRSLGDSSAVDARDEIQKLKDKAEKALGEIYAKLSPWQKTEVARHPDRPHTSHYIARLLEDFTPLAGDRAYAEDAAIIAGVGRLDGHSVAVLGHERGVDTESRLRHNFGMARPEGYRKAKRIMQMAERFRLPVVTLIDTAGAYPGIGAEERGQAEAIARSTEQALTLTVPTVAVVIGEGGSGGALALAASNRVMMLEHAIYSVISPEGAASILWRDAARAQDAAANMKITAQDLLRLGVIDDIIEEPVGGAHRDRNVAIDRVGEKIASALRELRQEDGAALKSMRAQRFLNIGRSLEV
ncbi:acetyl-CoA carboxylase carboxyl transferase subunit alpha [Acuticoccus sediminis]|uniref:Acetyl-coenzyme A carboxylase carboxyl transferase subunit alpha n=1 Tax=Acuticoccus sediminis TaxID=2184697 RepID=A0A8B2NL30_9HYPH|nr:acetyl-CoA carboxylase carboxyltransferase subunit alpha [Acuticoccus sediminis]RAH99260.1 acetyl-CoA carboxylase carboxyl transferase subunit alpha [Acuticoccus sediminis]